MTDRALVQAPAVPLPAFAPTAFGEREFDVIEKYRETPRAMRTTARRADNRMAKGVHGWAAVAALDDLFAHRWWVTTREIIQDKDVIVKVTFFARTDGDGALVREAYGGRRINTDKAFIVGNSTLADALKAAEADALKKIAAQLGMFQDVYRQAEVLEERSVAGLQPGRAPPTNRGGPPDSAGGPPDSARNKPQSFPERTDEERARRGLWATAKEAGLDDEVKLKEFLGTDSLKGLADHMVGPRARCEDPDCARPHGMTGRAMAYKAMANWIKKEAQRQKGAKA